MALHRLLTWRDERFEAPSPRCVVLTRSILAHLEAQNIAAGFALDFFKRVGEARLVLAQLQSDVLQPCLRQVATWFDNGAVPREDNQSVRVADYLRLPMELTAGVCRVSSRPAWAWRADTLFESVQSEVRQPRRRYTSYKVANLPIEFSTSIPRTQLRPGYGEGFLGAPLQSVPSRERPAPRGQGDPRGTSRTHRQHNPGGAHHV
jgi:hypothetical protein